MASASREPQTIEEAVEMSALGQMARQFEEEEARKRRKEDPREKQFRLFKTPITPTLTPAVISRISSRPSTAKQARDQEAEIKKMIEQNEKLQRELRKIVAQRKQPYDILMEMKRMNKQLDEERKQLAEFLDMVKQFLKDMKEKMKEEDRQDKASEEAFLRRMARAARGLPPREKKTGTGRNVKSMVMQIAKQLRDQGHSPSDSLKTAWQMV